MLVIVAPLVAYTMTPMHCQYLPPQIQQCTTQPTLPLTQLGPPSDNHDDDDVILKQMILVALENAYPQYLLGTLTTFVSMKR